MKDLRIAFNLLDHPKKIKLQRRCGIESFENLLRLWMFVAQTKPKGILTDMDSEDIEIASKWKGEIGIFSKSLIDVGLLRFKEGMYSINDWEEHNPFAFYGPERSLAAKKAGIASAKKRGAKWQAVQLPVQLPVQQDDDESSTPSPSPSPSPSINNKKKINKRKKVSISTSVPIEFPITEQMINYAKKIGYVADLLELTESFIIYHTSIGSTFSCWYSAWQIWIRNQIKWYPERNIPKGQPIKQNLKPQTYAQAQDAERRERSKWLLKEMKNEEINSQNNNNGNLKVIGELSKPKDE